MTKHTLKGAVGASSRKVKRSPEPKLDNGSQQHEKPTTSTESYTLGSYTELKMFDPLTVHKSMTTTKKDKLKLLFRRNYYTSDTSAVGTTLVRYKKMGDTVYVMDVKHTEATEVGSDTNRRAKTEPKSELAQTPNKPNEKGAVDE